MLAVVEDDEGRAVPEVLGDAREGVGRAPGVRGPVAGEVQGGGDGIRHGGLVGDRGQFDQPHLARPAVGPVLLGGRHLDRQAGLAGPARPGQGDQPVRRQALPDAPDVVVPPHERGQCPAEAPGSGRGRPGHGPGGPVREQAGILAEDRHLQRLQLGPGVDAQLLGEGGPGLAERGEGVGLAAGPVQGQHQLAPQPLAQRLLLDQRRQLAGQLAVAPEGEVGLDAVLEGRPAQLLQPPSLELEEPVVAHVGEGLAPPQAQCPAQRVGGGRGLAPAERDAPLGGEVGEGEGVDVVGAEGEGVAVRPEHQRLAPQRPPGLRHPGLEGVGHAAGQVVAPQQLDEAVGRHDLAAVERQHRHQRLLLGAGQRDGPLAIGHQERPEHTDPHRPTVRLPVDEVRGLAPSGVRPGRGSPA
ncbi:MAG TPA: hypothetical protein VKA65_03790 [Acidimicrobiales bacterium]|nr:hypothetical protein [Acidimicrobiales bacterium]